MSPCVADGTRAGARFCKATKAAKVAARAAAAAAAAGEESAEATRPSAPPVEDDGAYEDVIVQELQEKYLRELHQLHQHQEQLHREPEQVDEQGELVAPRCPYYYADLLLPRAPPRENRRRNADTR